MSVRTFKLWSVKRSRNQSFPQDWEARGRVEQQGMYWWISEFGYDKYDAMWELARKLTLLNIEVEA